MQIRIANPSRSIVSPTVTSMRRVKHRACDHAGMKLALLAAGIGARRQFGEQRIVEAPAGERLRQLLEIDTDEIRLDARRDHLARQRIGRALPQRKQRRDAGAGELLLAIGAHVFEKQIAEDHVRDALRASPRRAPPPCGLRRSRSGTDRESARSPTAARAPSCCARKISSRTPCMLTRSKVSVTVVSAPTTS